jgi:hypothetical protein
LSAIEEENTPISGLTHQVQKMLDLELVNPRNAPSALDEFGFHMYLKYPFQEPTLGGV